NSAKGGFDYFFYDTKESDNTNKVLKQSNNWFIAVMMRGYMELYVVDKNPIYVQTFQENLDYAWQYMRESNGLFNKDWSGSKQEKSKWLLDQFAIVEMFARISNMK